jgi:hypothetical protein
VGFLFPLFLLAAATLAIPVIIHLFNLRRYKTVLFPHTRFLKDIQLRSRRQSQVRYKWLLALRLLLLAALILAFAQPFFTDRKVAATSGNLQVIYVDNSASMSLKKGARSLLEIARDAARKQVLSAPPNTRFLLLTNDKPISYSPLAADKILAALDHIEVSPTGSTNVQQLAIIQGILQSEQTGQADLYYYADFQRNAFAARPEAALLKGINLHAISVQAPVAGNIFIDTAYLSTPSLQSGQAAQLIVRSVLKGKAPAEAPVLQLNINGQVKSAASLSFDTKPTSVDTLGFSVNDAGWQQLTLTVNDASVRFDDTFRISVRSAPGLSILVLNEGQANPYIQAAFRSYSGFRLMQENISNTPANWKDYNLVILNGITTLDETLSKRIGDALQAGQSICIFPGKTRDLTSLNAALKYAGDIRFSALDTSTQTATALQQGSDLVKDLFEHIPENVQLPVASWHYQLQSGLNANQQAILSFRNGDPFFARYTPSKGALYIAATAADADAGNFPSSYFFVPFLYQMAAQSTGGNVYALTSGAGQSAFVPLTDATDRNVIHVLGAGIDAIPPQRATSGGVSVQVDAAVQQPGFYRLAAGVSDSVLIAMNASRTESDLDTWTMNTLKKEWAGKEASWQSLEEFNATPAGTGNSSFPLWKVCIILALLLLAAETWLLVSSKSSQSIATT